MAFSSLSGRLKDLPLVLAGPILRQVTPSQVTVWFALQGKATVTVNVLDDTGQRVMQGSGNTTAIGTSLHVVAVTAYALPPHSPLTEGVVYQYTVEFGDLDDLKSATTKGGVAARLTYSPYNNPSFCLPPTDPAKIRLFHGSCRKPHAEGGDALGLLDSLIAAKASSPYERPQQLILTGDQIYADDVADVLLMLLNDAGNVLLGWGETLDTKPLSSPIPIKNWPSYYRLAILSDAKFTSDDLKSHLATLGEFFSMYMFAWSDVLWPDALPGFDDVLAWVTSFTSGSVKDRVTKYITALKSTVVEEQGNVATFKSTLANVRCALANIPTYMICDDHEVTDDWNMTLRFCEQVYGTPIGMRIVQNALVAFSVCQAWGNTPDRFTATAAGATLLGKLADVSAGKVTYEAASPQIQPLLGVHPAAAVIAANAVFHDGEDKLVNGVNTQSLRFNFLVEGPGHVIVVTDTRTWRAFPNIDGHGTFLPTAGQPEMTRQFTIPSGQATFMDSRILLVVVTTNAPPIASFRFASSNPALVDLGKNPKDDGWQIIKDLFWSDIEGAMKHDADHQRRAVLKYDLYDSWEFPSTQFNSLIAELDSLVQSRGSQQVILLSGDVHSSFASRLTLFTTGSTTAPRMAVAQLISSAFKNQKDDTRAQQLEGYEYGPGWIARKLVPDFVPESFNGPTLGGTSTKYRLDYLVAVPGGPSSPPKTVAIQEGDDIANLRTYKYVAEYKNTLVYDNPTALQIIGHNNIAELTFSWGTNKRVRHTLHWIGPQNQTFSTAYDVSLNLTDAPYGSLP